MGEEFKDFEVEAPVLTLEPDLTEEKEEITKEDIELQNYLEELRTRPELKMLFSLTKNATKADVEKAVKIIETMIGR